MSKKSSDSLDLDQYNVEKRFIITQDELDQYEKGQFKRYNLEVENGISPRSIPGQRNGRYVALSNEHDEVGVEIEEPTLRKAMFEKRMKKLVGFDLGELAMEYIGEEGAKLLLIGFGSLRSQLVEVIEQLGKNGRTAGVLIIKQLKPFPKDRVFEIMERAERIMVIENNGTGQLANLLLQEVGFHHQLEVQLKYDGNPFRIDEILRAIENKEGVSVR
jgi:2-oxoglutarate ferredoxin oxidoreductase subunit alpha